MVSGVCFREQSGHCLLLTQSGPSPLITAAMHNIASKYRRNQARPFALMVIPIFEVRNPWGFLRCRVMRKIGAICLKITALAAVVLSPLPTAAFGLHLGPFHVGLPLGGHHYHRHHLYMRLIRERRGSGRMTLRGLNPDRQMNPDRQKA